MTTYRTLIAGALFMCSSMAACRLAEAATADERAIEQVADATATHQKLLEGNAPYDAVFRRDPMRQLVDERGELTMASGFSSGYAVQGIIWSPEHPLAIIDDELYATGAQVGPYTILEIRADGVVAQRGSETLFVPLDRSARAIPTPADPAAADPVPAPEPATASP